MRESWQPCILLTPRVGFLIAAFHLGYFLLGLLFLFTQEVDFMRLHDFVCIPCYKLTC